MNVIQRRSITSCRFSLVFSLVSDTIFSSKVIHCIQRSSSAIAAEIQLELFYFSSLFHLR